MYSAVPDNPPTTSRHPGGARGEATLNTDARPMASLADLVRQARLSRRMSQRRLSHALGKSQGYVGHLESGRFRPNVDTLKALATVLDISYGHLAVEAGYIAPHEFHNPIDGTQLARLNEVNDLTDEEWESVKEFSRYVRSRRAAGPR